MIPENFNQKNLVYKVFICIIEGMKRSILGLLRFLGNLLWMISLERESRRDHYGEIILYFFIYPYRCFEVCMGVMGLLWRVECWYFLLFIWTLAILFKIVDLILDNNERYNKYLERKLLERIEKERERERIKGERVIEGHKNDPLKMVKKVGGG